MTPLRSIIKFRNVLCVAATIAMLFSGSGVTWADTDARSLKELYDSGRKNYNLGLYQDALRDFQSAYRVKDDPVFLFNIAQCQRNLHQYEDAERSYRAYLRESSDVSTATREQVQKLIAEMDRAVAEQRAKQPPTGTEASTSAGAESTKGAADMKSTEQRSAGPAQTTLVAAAPAKSKPIYQRGWFWGVMAGATVVVAGGVALGVTMTRSSNSPDTVPGVTF